MNFTEMFLKKTQHFVFSLLSFSCHDCDRVSVTSGQKSTAGPETFPVKTQILLVNGQKDGCTDDPPDLT